MEMEFYRPKHEGLSKFIEGYYFISPSKIPKPLHYWTFPNNFFIVSVSSERGTFERVATKLRSEFSVGEVNTFFGLLKDGTYFKEGNLLVTLMLRESIIERDTRNDLSNAKAYRLTDYGDRFLMYWNNNVSDNEVGKD